MRNPAAMGWHGPAALIGVLLLHAAAAAPAQTGELRIEGGHIRELVLRDHTGATKTFPSPGAGVTLPVGDYSLDKITLDGGHSCPSYQLAANPRLTIQPGGVAVVKVGAPLRQVLKVERLGPVMLLNYELIGQGGERYSISRPQSSRQPSFTVYKGDTAVASGDFAFG